MPRVYWVTCPACQFRYYVGHSLVRVPGFPTCCPRCHHEFGLERSNPPVDPPPPLLVGGADPPARL